MNNNDKEFLEGVTRGKKKKEPERVIAKNFIVHFDYGVSVQCSKCKDWNEYPSGSKQAMLIAQKSDAADTWLCDKCYRETKKSQAKESEIPSWAIGQALNLAQAELLSMNVTSDLPGFWERLETLKIKYLEFILK